VTAIVLHSIGPSLIHSRACVGAWSNTREVAPLACLSHSVVQRYNVIQTVLFSPQNFFEFLFSWSRWNCEIYQTNSSKSPTRCNSFTVYYPDVYLQLKQV